MSESHKRLPKVDPLVRFAAFVEKSEMPDSCWTWIGSKTPDGYGNFYLGEKVIRSHRASYILHVGPIPDGTQVLHRCDNPACVRPDHLFLGSHDDNMKDASSKGRLKGSLGYRHAESVRKRISSSLAGKAKSEAARDAYRDAKRAASPMDPGKVARLKGLRDQGWSFRALAAEFGISVTTAFNICKGKTWG